MAEDAVTCEPFSALKQRIIQGRSALHAADAPKIPLDLAICANTSIIDQGNNRQSDAAFLILGQESPSVEFLCPKTMAVYHSADYFRVARDPTGALSDAPNHR